MLRRRSGGRAARAFALAASAAAVICAQTSDAQAGGLFVADRGARPLARGGAFVAGADDLGAIAYNPAGIFDAGASVFLDAAWVDYQAHFQRRALVTQVDPNTGQPVATYEQTFDQVTGGTPFLPIPTVVGSFRPHDQWVVALGAYAPYAAQLDYPQDVNGRAAPQRYSAVSLKGSVLAVIGAFAAFAPSKELRIGFGAGMLVGTFNSLVTFTACIPDRFLCAEEDPAWDVLAELKAGPIVSPHGIAGIQWQPIPLLRLGLPAQLPTWIQTGGSLRTRLAASPIFEQASQQGDGVEVKFWLPAIVRLGAELRPTPELRIELAGKYESWSLHDKIEVNPQGIELQNLALLPASYKIPQVQQERRFQDSLAVQLGAEYFVRAGSSVRVIPRAGASFESGAVQRAYLSPLTPDVDKVTTALGLGLEIGRVRLDVTYARVWNFDTEVPTSEARQYPVRAVVANPPPSPTPINAGLYTADVNVVAVGFQYTLAPPTKAYVPQPEPEKRPPPVVEKKPTPAE